MPDDNGHCSNEFLYKFKSEKRALFVHTRTPLLAQSGIDYFDFADWHKSRSTMASLAIPMITFYLFVFCLSAMLVCVCVRVLFSIAWPEEETSALFARIAPRVGLTPQCAMELGMGRRSTIPR